MKTNTSAGAENISQEQVAERAEWVTVVAEAALYADIGRAVVLCDRLPRPVTLVMKVSRTEIFRALGQAFPISNMAGDRP